MLVWATAVLEGASHLVRADAGCMANACASERWARRDTGRDLPGASGPRGILGACVGHEAGDSKGQQRCPAGSRALTLTSSEGSKQRRSPGHAVYGMQGVSGP